jgi:hypothetical protein
VHWHNQQQIGLTGMLRNTYVKKLIFLKLENPTFQLTKQMMMEELIPFTKSLFRIVDGSRSGISNKVKWH